MSHDAIEFDTHGVELQEKDKFWNLTRSISHVEWAN